MRRGGKAEAVRDLGHRGIGVAQLPFRFLDPQLGLPLVRGEPRGRRKAARDMIRRQFAEIGEFAQPRPLVAQIGRASWWESVGQNVWISGGAGYLKKKQRK